MKKTEKTFSKEVCFNKKFFQVLSWYTNLHWTILRFLFLCLLFLFLLFHSLQCYWKSYNTKKYLCHPLLFSILSWQDLQFLIEVTHTLFFLVVPDGWWCLGAFKLGEWLFVIAPSACPVYSSNVITPAKEGNIKFYRLHDLKNKSYLKITFVSHSSRMGHKSNFWLLGCLFFRVKYKREVSKRHFNLL